MEDQNDSYLDMRLYWSNKG